MRKILALAVVGAVSLSSMVIAMAQQTPQNPTRENPAQAPSSQSPSSQSPSSQSPSSQSPSSQPSSKEAPANQIDSTRTQSNERSLTEFWTPERLREARPMPTPQVDPNEVKK
jgi:cytoskeletal protein RodZ